MTRRSTDREMQRALEADGEKLRQLTGEDHGPYFDSYNDGYTHEAMHTTSVLMQTFEAHVMDSRCAAKFPDVFAQADKVHQAMADLYQLIGNKFAEPKP